MVNTSDILPNTPRYLKVPLIFFNSILFVLGIILIALGGVSLTALQSVKQLINVSIPAGIIVLGVFIMILTIVGCVVAYKERLAGLIFYTIVMIILLICLIGVGGGAYTYRDQVDKPMEVAWRQSSPAARVRLQEYFKCCGWNNELGLYAYSPGYVCMTPKATPAPTTPAEPATPAPTSAPTSAPTPSTSAPTPSTSAPTPSTSAPTPSTSAPTPSTSAPTPSTSAPTSPLVKRAVLADTPTPTTAPDPNYTYNTDAAHCQDVIVPFVQDKLYIAAIGGLVVGVIEFVCMLFSLFLIVRLCRGPKQRQYE